MCARECARVACNSVSVVERTAVCPPCCCEFTFEAVCLSEHVCYFVMCSVHNINVLTLAHSSLNGNFKMDLSCPAFTQTLLLICDAELLWQNDFHVFYFVLNFDCL